MPLWHGEAAGEQEGLGAVGPASPRGDSASRAGTSPCWSRCTGGRGEVRVQLFL